VSVDADRRAHQRQAPDADHRDRLLRSRPVACCAQHRSAGVMRVGRSAEHGFRFSKRSAEHGFEPPKRSAQQGFTMIELMVVIVIIGLMSAAVMLTTSDPRGGLSNEADRFAGRVRAAHDRAVVLARPVALWVSPTGYGFEERRDGRWMPLDQKPLTATDW